MTIFSSKFPYPVPFFCETYNDSIHIKKGLQYFSLHCFQILSADIIPFWHTTWRIFLL